MSQSQSCYDILGVSRTATTQEIRTAYVRLMKRHHPDASAREDGGADLAPLLNRCYALLRDPVKRSKHDAQLPASYPVPLAPPHLYHFDPRRGKRGWGRVIALVGTVGFALFWAALNLVGDRTTREFAATSAGWMPRSPSDATSRALPLPDTAVNKRMAHLARTLSTRDAEHFSRECFAAARRQLNPQSADWCVLFDAAFLYWRKTPVPTAAFPTYFADQVVDDRHSELAIAFGASGEKRLVNLRERALQALMQGLQLPPPEPTTTSPVVD